MQTKNDFLKTKYLEKYKILNFFSFDVSDKLELYRFKKGEFIFAEWGDNRSKQLTNLFFLVEGRTRVITPQYNGRFSIVAFNMPFDVIGDLELLNIHHYVLSVQAIQDVICIGLSLTDSNFREMLLNDNYFLRLLCQSIGRKMLHNTMNLVINQTYSAEARLVRNILMLQSDGIYKENFSNISGYLGISYRHLQRIIEKLCKENILHKTSKGYKILDFNYLNSFNVSIDNSNNANNSFNLEPENWILSNNRL